MSNFPHLFPLFFESFFDLGVDVLFRSEVLRAGVRKLKWRFLCPRPYPLGDLAFFYHLVLLGATNFVVCVVFVSFRSFRLGSG